MYYGENLPPAIADSVRDARAVWIMLLSDSKFDIDGMFANCARTARVAGRSAYELVLTPKEPASLVASVRLAIDSEQHVPLRVQVFAKGSTDPAFEVALQLGRLQPAGRGAVRLQPAGRHQGHRAHAAGPPRHGQDGYGAPRPGRRPVDGGR